MKKERVKKMNVLKDWEQETIEILKKDPMLLKDIKTQTEVVCLEAVKRNGSALLYVKNRTEMICLEAVKEKWSVLEYVENQTEEMCLEALFSEGVYKGEEFDEEDEPIYEFIQSPTEEMTRIKEILMKTKLKSYRQIRSRLANQEISLTDSPYHVLEQLYSF